MLRTGYMTTYLDNLYAYDFTPLLLPEFITSFTQNSSPLYANIKKMISNVFFSLREFLIECRSCY